MKKLIIIFFISFIGLYINGQEALTLSIDKIDSKSLSKGDKVSVKIELDKTSFRLSSFQLYIKFDQVVLEYQETKQINSKFGGNWHDNIINDLYAALFVDLTQTGFEVSEKIVLCELEFIYLGGDTDLKFGTENQRVDEVLRNGETKFTDLSNNNMPLNLLDGCICNNE